MVLVCEMEKLFDDGKIRLGDWPIIETERVQLWLYPLETAFDSNRIFVDNELSENVATRGKVAQDQLRTDNCSLPDGNHPSYLLFFRRAAGKHVRKNLGAVGQDPAMDFETMFRAVAFLTF